MKRRLAYLALGSLLAACGSSANNNVIFDVDAPPDMDFGCIGVAGFDVTISSGSGSSPSGALLNAAPILDPTSCHLGRPFSAPDLDLDSPATVIVQGRDGAGVVRVQASGHIDNLRGSPPHLQLRSATAPPLPLLVVYRVPLLGSTPLSDVTILEISTMKKTLPLVAAAQNPYFAVEPAAYAVPANLGPGGADDGLAINVDITTTQGALPRTKATARWKGTYYAAE